MTFGEKIDKVLENQARQEVRQENIEKQQKEHHESLYGNGKDGVVIKVDRLERSNKVSRAIQAVIGTAVLGGVIRFIFQHLGH